MELTEKKLNKNAAIITEVTIMAIVGESCKNDIREAAKAIGRTILQSLAIVVKSTKQKLVSNTKAQIVRSW